MKGKSILAALFLLVAGLQTAMAQKMIVTLNDNSQVTYSISQVKEVTFVEADEPVNDEHEYVDLGLPSGTLWATCNVGASKPEEYGDYFAWGETTPKSTYNWSTYKWCNGSRTTMTKYCTQSEYGYNDFTDNLTELQPADDAATANWGSGWQMPSSAQIEELYNSSYTTTEWTQQNGVNGRKITSKSNGNSIFLPAAGYRYDTRLGQAGSYGYYWSRPLNAGDSGRAYYLSFYSGGIDCSNGYRYYGRSVRPVRFSSASPVQLVTSITLSQTSLSLEVGKTQMLTATVLPSNATNKTVIWTSSNTSVATVSTSGRVTANANGTCTITCAATDGSGVKATCQVTVGSSGQQGNHEYVDLGLPSGTLWATCNVGASKPEEYGDYFAWGETTPKSTYNWSTYKWCNGSRTTMTKYCTQSEYGYNDFTDNLTELQPADDAATANWGSGWQMPSSAQIEELYNSSYTTTEWTQQNGVNGRKITSKSNGNSIFLPAAGYRYDTRLGQAGSYGYYWSRPLNAGDSGRAYYLSFYSGGIDCSNGYRYYGRSVRPVRFSSASPVQLVTSITLSQTSLSLEVGKTQMLTATVLPSNATNKTVIWTSSNTSVATVSTSGMVTANAYGTCTITCAATDGSGVKAECQVTVAGAVDNSGTINGREYVDLGLPSGTLWATCNVGASKPEEYGDYFAWGETTTKSIYNWSTYKWCKGSEYKMTKYCTLSDSGYNGFTDNLTELQPADDAATANWGSGWQMPSLDQFKELFNSEYTTTEWTQQNGVNGRKVTSKSNGNSIFLPAVGYRIDARLNYAGSGGYYWSRSLNTSGPGSAYYLYFVSGTIGWDYYYRGCGQGVRPVRILE